MTTKTAELYGFTEYREFRPTAFDGHITLEDREHWAVAPVAQNRDSGCLEQSNFQQFLDGLGGESEHVEVHRFGHWANGWFEIIIFDPNHQPTAAAAYDMAVALQDYPVLDETDLSQREFDEYCESWDFWGRRDFQREMERELESMGCPCSAQFVGNLDSDQVDEIWESLRDRLNWEYQGEDSGVSINIDGAINLLERNHYAEIVRRYR